MNTRTINRHRDWPRLRPRATAVTIGRSASASRRRPVEVPSRTILLGDASRAAARACQPTASTAA